MAALKIYQFTCREDNFGVLLHDPESGETASIDAPVEEAILEALENTGWQLSHILVTHWHFDHVEAIEALKAKFGCKVIGPALEADKIKGLDQTVDDNEEFSFGSDRVRVILTPGHTLGMINFHFIDTKAVFAGDTLFALGCGRLFEGDGPMMWKSLQKLAKLPGETAVYCGHEYTLANGKFALSIDPGNEKLGKRMDEIIALREAGRPTLPTTIALELETNPFMRPHDKAIRAHLNMPDASDGEVFTEIRRLKDNFQVVVKKL